MKDKNKYIFENNATAVIGRLKIALNVDKDVGISKLLNVSGGVISNWRARNTIPYEHLIVVSLDKGISLTWLLTGKGDMMGENKRDYTQVPVYHISASAGGGSFIDNEEEKSRLLFSNDYLNNDLKVLPKNAIIIYIVGDSMEPTLTSGEPILIDKSICSIIADGIYVFRVDDVLHCKRIQKNIDGSIDVISDNSAYKTFQISKNSSVDVKIIGRVVLHIKKI